jgi:hypothetical protein
LKTWVRRSEVVLHCLEKEGLVDNGDSVMVDDLDPTKGAFYQGYIDAVDLERVFAPKAAVKKVFFREFRAQNLQDFSLARDGIADMTINSKFRRSLAPNVGRAASRVDPVSNLHEHWPTLTDVLERVFAKNHYDSVNDAIAEESMRDPVARYIMSIIHL